MFSYWDITVGLGAHKIIKYTIQAKQPIHHMSRVF